jgi:hypothetical protein
VPATGDVARVLGAGVVCGVHAARVPLVCSSRNPHLYLLSAPQTFPGGGERGLGALDAFLRGGKRCQ